MLTHPAGAGPGGSASRAPAAEPVQPAISGPRPKRSKQGIPGGSEVPAGGPTPGQDDPHPPRGDLAEPGPKKTASRGERARTGAGSVGGGRCTGVGGVAGGGGPGPSPDPAPAGGGGTQ